MKHLDQYLEHCAGIYNFLAWLEEESKLGIPYEISNQVILFNNLISRYFSFGVATGSKDIFLAVQPSEAEWFSLIKWTKVIVRENDSYLYFLAKTIEGDQKEQPDIPSFGIGLYIDTLDKINLISQLNSLSGREYYKDESSKIYVNFHKRLFNIPVETYEENETILNSENIFDYSQILAMKEHGLQDIFTSTPEFIGDVNEAQALLGKWKQKEEALMKNAEKLK